MYEEGAVAPGLTATMHEHSPSAVRSIEMLGSRLEDGMTPASEDALLDVMIVGRWLDNTMDAIGTSQNLSGPVEHAKQFLLSDGQAPAWGKPMYEASGNRLRGYLATHDEIGVSSFTHYLDKWAKIVKQQKAPMPPAAVAEYTRLEGETIARIMISLLPIEARHNAANAGVFTWFRRLSAFGNTVDNLFDLRTDMASDRLNIAAVPGTYAHLAYSACADVVPTVKELQKPEIRNLAGIALRIFGHRHK
jgi:hypothetical protein